MSGVPGRAIPAGTAVFLAALLLASGASARPASAQQFNPFSQDPLGPLRDVTHDWRDYQPAPVFCVRPNAFEATGRTGATATGRAPACRRSGFPREAEGLYRVKIRVPSLCPGCRRLFLNYSKIPAENDPPLFFAHGHVYFRLMSDNPTYTVDPRAHSPNVKNLTNDKLVVPEGSPQEPPVHAFDLHAMSYVGDTKRFAHSALQGPWYIGPWYLNEEGRRIRGAYLDVDVAGAEPMGDPSLDGIGYQSGFNSGEATCPDNVLFGGEYADGNYLYGGCVDHFGGSSREVNPFR